MKLSQLIYIWCLVGLLAGCKGEKQKQSGPVAYESFPQEVYYRLFAECDYVDIIFFDSPVAMSQDEPAGIQGSLAFITPQPATHDPSCKPVGRITYMIKGEVIADGNFYCSNGCTYVLFMENNEPVYANTLSPQGVQFFSNILKQIEQQVPNQ